MTKKERRHIEQLAATIAAGFVAHGYGSGEEQSTYDLVRIPKLAVGMARAIQREAAEPVPVQAAGGEEDRDD